MWGECAKKNDHAIEHETSKKPAKKKTKEDGGDDLLVKNMVVDEEDKKKKWVSFQKKCQKKAGKKRR
jgi:hypothetical protein